MLNMQTKRVKATFFTGVFSAWLMMSVTVNASDLVLTSEQYQTLGLQVAEAKKVQQFPSMSFPAQAMFHPGAIQTLSSPLSGRVSKLNVIHGAVHKGQVIAEIESPELLGLQSQLLAVMLDLEVAQDELKRIEQLRKSGSASLKKWQQAQAEVTKLKAEKKQQMNALQLVGMSRQSVKKLMSSQTIQSAILQMVSPVDGQIFDLNVRLGERIMDNHPLFSLGKTQSVLFVVRVPVALANQLKIGDKAKIKQVGLAKVEFIDPEVDSMTQMVDVHVQVDNQDNRIRLGQRFQIQFLMMSKRHQAQNVYQIPSNAISQFDGKTVVFVKAKDGIQPKEILVMNITDNQLYFSFQSPDEAKVDVFVKGSTAIKSAFEAAENGDEA